MRACGPAGIRGFPTFAASAPMSSPATGFSESEHALSVRQTLEMDTLIAANSAIMDRYDAQKRIALAVDG